LTASDATGADQSGSPPGAVSSLFILATPAPGNGQHGVRRRYCNAIKSRPSGARGRSPPVLPPKGRLLKENCRQGSSKETSALVPGPEATFYCSPPPGCGLSPGLSSLVGLNPIGPGQRTERMIRRAFREQSPLFCSPKDRPGKVSADSRIGPVVALPGRSVSPDFGRRTTMASVQKSTAFGMRCRDIRVYKTCIVGLVDPYTFVLRLSGATVAASYLRVGGFGMTAERSCLREARCERIFRQISI
jgi:hypothetical protein